MNMAASDQLHLLDTTDYEDAEFYLICCFKKVFKKLFQRSRRRSYSGILFAHIL
jgi:hypothetical protein